MRHKRIALNENHRPDHDSDASACFTAMVELYHAKGDIQVTNCHNGKFFSALFMHAIVGSFLSGSFLLNVPESPGHRSLAVFQAVSGTGAISRRPQSCSFPGSPANGVRSHDKPTSRIVLGFLLDIRIDAHIHFRIGVSTNICIPVYRTQYPDGPPFPGDPKSPKVFHRLLSVEAFSTFPFKKIML